MFVLWGGYRGGRSAPVWETQTGFDVSAHRTLSRPEAFFLLGRATCVLGLPSVLILLIAHIQTTRWWADIPHVCDICTIIFFFLRHGRGRLRRPRLPSVCDGGT
ncbi:hypothetical protein BDZ88DRAFT_112890 [Geranomyces variabilis]|nr:hypothetical protein BDZ88DRAFT_112890 [Geranomyces variabilis]